MLFRSGVTLDSNFPNFYLNFCLINIFHLIIVSRIEIFEIEILMCSNRFFFFLVMIVRYIFALFPNTLDIYLFMKDIKSNPHFLS